MLEKGKRTRGTRAGLEREVHLLIEGMEYKGMDHLQKDLMKIRLAPNGRLDLSSVQETMIAGAKPVRLRKTG